jgi:hypothetical protein
MTVDMTAIRAAHLLIAHLGVSPDDLVWTPPAIIPTIADYLPRVELAEGPGARRTYSTYWDRILEAFGDRRLDQITATDIETLMRHVMATTVPRRNQQHGLYAGEHLIAAIRAIYTHAINDELLPAHRNPAAKVNKPRRPPNGRRALHSAELTAINTIVVQTGNDAPLDSLLLRLHTETACRRAAALTSPKTTSTPNGACCGCTRRTTSSAGNPPAPT